MATAYVPAEESVRLEDGTVVALRMLRPSDADRLRSGFEQLSQLSRFRRFHAARRKLSDAEVEYLCSPDGVCHVAIGALADEDGLEVPAGVARFIRADPKSPTAEAAITVVDAYQHRGLGSLLMTRLAELARDVGVEQFELSVLASNEPMLRWLQKSGADLRALGAGDIAARLSVRGAPHDAAFRGARPV